MRIFGTVQGSEKLHFKFGDSVSPVVYCQLPRKSLITVEKYHSMTGIKRRPPLHTTIQQHRCNIHVDVVGWASRGPGFLLAVNFKTIRMMSDT